MSAPSNADAVISIRHLAKTFSTAAGPRPVLEDITLDVRRGSFVCIVGPSGAGKTTFLRCIAGLLPPTSGEVRVDDVVVDRPPKKLAVVFQDYSRSLMPWMSVMSNVTLPLRSQGLDKAARLARAEEALVAVGLGGFEKHYPWQLSGGMQQRVAIARGLAYQPDALVMDEPFASLDAQTRADLENLVLSVRERFSMTVLFVTHDIDEAVYLGDEVVVLSAGPARVNEIIPIDLGRQRDHLTTKEMPEFVSLRSRVLRLIQQARPQVKA